MSSVFKRFIAFLISAMFITTVFSYTALADENVNSGPEITAETGILMESKTGRIVYAKDMDKKMFPASMTKILTALITLDYFEYDTLITVGTEINSVSYDSSKAGHKVGETLTVKNLIRGLLIPSGNDSANVLASAVAKKIKNDENLSYGECEKIFAELMNNKAKELGATNSNFVNPHGYQDENHYTTAYDMALITKAALQNDILRDIVTEKSFSGDGADNTLENSSSLKTQKYKWVSHNLLITDGEYNYPYATGVKTGFTDEAGDCLSASAKKDDVELIAVLFNSPSPGRWEDAKNLFEYGFLNYSFMNLATANDVMQEVNLTNHNRLNGDTLKVIIKEDIPYYLTAEESQNIIREISYNDGIVSTSKNENETGIKLKAPIVKESEIGTVKFILNNQVLKEATLYASEDIYEKTIGSTLKYFFKNLPSKVFTQKGILTIATGIAAILILFMIIKLIMKKIKRKRRHNRYGYKMKLK